MINGIINVYKEKGYTSHDVVAKLRGILRQKKIGHTGTLDPDATGVLPVCLGSATRLCDMLTDKSKEYKAVMLLGVTTDTEDITGSVLSQKNVDLPEQQVEEAILSFVGSYGQIPPMYSAIKVGGRKLYELARDGIEIQRRPRNVTIDFIKVEKIDLPRVAFTVGCQKGTYIRSLCRDIGEKLGCGACMESLVRTRVGNNLLENAVTLDEIEKLYGNGQIDKVVQPADGFFEEYPKVTVSGRNEKLVRNGNKFRYDDKTDKPDMVRVYFYKGENDMAFAGLYQYDRDNDLYKPFKMFLNGE